MIDLILSTVMFSKPYFSLLLGKAYPERGVGLVGTVGCKIATVCHLCSIKTFSFAKAKDEEFILTSSRSLMFSLYHYLTTMLKHILKKMLNEILILYYKKKISVYW